MENFYWVDAFSDGPFSGNPAAVCLLDMPASETWMQSLAFEMGLSETAFVIAEDGAFRLRWFTPKAEVKLCGHATLATCVALLDSGRADNSVPIRFQTLSGELRAWRRNDNGLIELDFPERNPETAKAPEGMLKALGLNHAEGVARAGEDWLVEVEDEAAVRSLVPDFSALAAVDCRGVCVCSRAEDSSADFVSRFFAPRMGVNEDPVTGSAHCYLGPWWAAILGRTELLGRQLSQRGGLVHVALKNGRAFLSGQGRVVFKGKLSIDPVK